jgi:AcrR family transcriptional regulator
MDIFTTLVHQMKIMAYTIHFKLNDALYVKDPESSALGKQIVSLSIDLIYSLGFETFTFKKLAAEVGTTEATVYRYFENKHRLLLYIINWYWKYLDFQINLQLKNITDSRKKLEKAILLLTQSISDDAEGMGYNKNALYEIVISESSKVYLIKDVEEINKHQVFKPYKELCSRIAEIITEYCPSYPYPKSLSSTLIESSHLQQFFSLHLPGLTDVNEKNKISYTHHFVSNLVFQTLDGNK